MARGQAWRGLAWPGLGDVEESPTRGGAWAWAWPVEGVVWPNGAEGEPCRGRAREGRGQYTAWSGLGAEEEPGRGRGQDGGVAWAGRPRLVFSAPRSSRRIRAHQPRVGSPELRLLRDPGVLRASLGQEGLILSRRDV